MRFLHAADIHIDSPLRGLDRYEGAPVDDVRGATRRAFENLVATALSERVDFVVIQGAGTSVQKVTVAAINKI